MTDPVSEPRTDASTCPVCGAPVTPYSTDEGTHSVSYAPPGDSEALADDRAHTEWARTHSGSSGCAAFYMDFDTKKPYPCSCGYAASLSVARPPAAGAVDRHDALKGASK